MGFYRHNLHSRVYQGLPIRQHHQHQWRHFGHGLGHTLCLHHTYGPFGQGLDGEDKSCTKLLPIPSKCASKWVILWVYYTINNLSVSLPLQKDARATLSLSEAQSDYCQKRDIDPEDPRCARVLLTGTVIEVRHAYQSAKKGWRIVLTG